MTQPPPDQPQYEPPQEPEPGHQQPAQPPYQPPGPPMGYPPPGGAGYPPQFPPPKTGVRPWVIISIVIGVSLLLCCAGGVVIALVSANKDSQSASPGPSRTFGAASLAPAPSAGAPTPPGDQSPAAPPPAEAPAPPPVPVQNYSGRGAKVLRITKAADSVALARITHRGGSNFVVTSVDAHGQSVDLLVNEIGGYSGTLLVDAQRDEASAALKIQADGAWTVSIKPLTSARAWNGSSVCSGRGDDVVLVSGVFTDLDSVRLTHNGTSNFVVEALGESSDLLVNEIGQYAGEQLVPSGTTVLSLKADGAWTMRKV